MKDIIISQGKKYISAKRASDISDYSSDYIGQLCRTGKLDCTMVGRSWFVTEESIHSHRADVLQNEIYRNRQANFYGGEKTHDKLVTRIDEVKSPEVVTTTEVAIAQEIKITPKEEKLNIASDLNFKYSSDNRPSLPILNKKVAPIFSSPTNISQNVYPKVSANVPTYPELAHSIVFRKTRNVVLVVCLVFGFVAGAVLVSEQSTDMPLAKNMSASVHDVLQSVSAFFKTGYENVLTLFGKNGSLAVHTPINEPASQVTIDDQSSALGIAVVPSSGSLESDQATKDKIQNSFSDEVVVNPDQSGTAGIITPVFRKSTGKDFMYVLVPVKDDSKKTNGGSP